MKKSAVLILVVCAIFIGIFVGRCSKHPEKIEKKPMYWVDTMEPTIHYSKSGKSRMGMELVPVYPDEGQAANPSSVRISPTVINNLGVRTSPVIQGTLAKRIETVGYVEPNENKISHIHTYADGWVRKLFVKAVGDVVKNGQVILQLYSPILVNVQEEYLIALGSKNQSLIDASEKRLQAFHISEQQIQQLKTTQKSSQLIDIYPHQDGIVTMLNIREGMHVTPDTEMMSIVDLSNIWMIAQVFEDQANWVKVGELAEARLSAFPGKVWKGEVEYVYPEVDPTTRSLKVRFRFNNPDGILKPNMYASIDIFAEPKQNVLSIPLEALIQSSQGNHVIVKLGDGQFQSRAVNTGIESGNRIEIISGLKAGEIVVNSGQFLIDSETNLKAGLDRIEGNSGSTNAKQSSTVSSILIEGKGIIKKIDPKNYSITLQHEAIPALNWPEMTMNFVLDKNVTLDQLRIGDQIQFSFKKDKENNYVIMEIKKLSN
jgi:Cu(I)/Ag(I) efflux system membrane fusion protein